MGESLQVSHVAQQFVAWLRVKAAPKTVAYYQPYLDRFVRHVEDCPIDQVRRLHVETFSARHHPLRAVRTFLRWCHEVGEVLARDPTKAVRVGKPGIRCRTLMRGERVIIRRRADAALRRAVLAMEETACRPQEMRGVEWEMIYPKPGPAAIAVNLADGQHWFRLDRYKCQELRADPSKPRIIPITPRLGRLLDRLRACDPSATGRIFRGPSGKPWTPNAFRCAFRRLRSALKAAGCLDVVGLVPYLYRHTRATQLARDGVNAHLLAEWLGHSSVKTAGRYCHFVEEDLGAIARRRWK